LRGGSFNVTIKTSNFDTDKSKFSLHIKGGRNPNKKNGTWVVIEEDEEDEDDFYFKIENKKENEVKVNVHIPVGALVSAYQFIVEDAASKKKFPADRIMYILFNPWNEKDEVYMEDDDLKNEYVLNDAGCAYWSGHKAKRWNFGQFTDAALKCTFKILESAFRVNMRDSARDVARHISMMANSGHPNGLLVGNWSNDFSGGVKPWMWNGSAAIFKKYLETGESVKYGQCWVFSGVTTSMMRCLGIPARSVTNYDSAHDVDGNCTDDKYFDEEYNYMPNESGDSVWNFHVWNDVWMARSDLPAGMGGWQAMDGTPQELSGGKYRCGPAPLQAIKEGKINMSYDARFVFAEVNADTVYWQKLKNGDVKPIRVKQNSVGTAVLTKKPNSYEVEDVTDQYKYREGSLLERAVMRNVMKKVKNPVLQAQPKDMVFSTRVPWNGSLDDELTVKINATNKKFQTLNVVATVIAHVVRYTGVTLKTLEKRVQEKEVKSKEGRNFKFKYDMSEFAEFMDENISVRFSMTARVQETGQVYVTQKICNMQKPELVMELLDNESGEVTDGDTMKVKLTIPKLNGIKRFTQATLMIESGLNIDNDSFELKDAEVNSITGFIEKSFRIGYNSKSKTCDLNVTFNAEEISGISGTMEVKYKAPEKEPQIEYGGCPVDGCDM
jgi:transglutaminase 1